MTTREAFEEWDRKIFDLPDRYYAPLYQGDFPSIDVKARWLAWQAATEAALERAVEEVKRTDKENWFAGRCAFSKHAAEAIRALKEQQ